MNAWFSRHVTKGELTELLAFTSITRESSIKHSSHYELPTSIGCIEIRSGYDIRLNKRKIGSMEMFRQEIYRMIKQGAI
jgi:hypothetical protein